MSNVRPEHPHSALTDKIIAGCIAVHRHLGPGLLESAYQSCLTHELSLRGHRVERERLVSLDYRGLRLDGAYRIDLVVDDCVIVEAKSVERVMPIHRAQLITYLRLTQIPVGLLVNFRLSRLVGILRARNCP